MCQKIISSFIILLSSWRAANIVTILCCVIFVKEIFNISKLVTALASSSGPTQKCSGCSFKKSTLDILNYRGNLKKDIIVCSSFLLYSSNFLSPECFTIVCETFSRYFASSPYILHNAQYLGHHGYVPYVHNDR